MALPLPPGLTPPEISFLCEMELVTVIPRQRLESLPLLGGPTLPLRPPQRSPLPLWLALLLKRQRRANIVPPPWLHPEALADILERETNKSKDAFCPPPPLPDLIEGDDLSDSNSHDHISPPFASSCTATAPADSLPYHWLEVAEILLSAAADDIVEPETVRRLLRDMREVRMAKIRKGVVVLDAGAGVQMNGVGAMEVGEGRAFVGGVLDVLRKLGASREQIRRERDEDAGLRRDSEQGDDEDEEMQL